MINTILSNISNDSTYNTLMILSSFFINVYLPVCKDFLKIMASVTETCLQ